MAGKRRAKMVITNPNFPGGFVRVGSNPGDLAKLIVSMRRGPLSVRHAVRDIIERATRDLMLVAVPVIRADAPARKLLSDAVGKLIEAGMLFSEFAERSPRSVRRRSKK